VSRGIHPEVLAPTDDERAVSAPFHSLVVPARGLNDPAPASERTHSVSDALVDVLVGLGVQYAFGLFGGGIAPFCEAIHRSPIQLVHFRHEAGAAFAAIEASLASGRLTVVVATTGPGVTNLYTGMVAARWEGAKVLFISGCTRASQRGRWAFQETSGYVAGVLPLFTPGLLFHHAAVLEDAAEIETVASRLATGITRLGGFVAHIGLPMAVQTAPARRAHAPRISSMSPPSCDAAGVRRCAELLANETFVIWVGFGARSCAEQVRALAERSGARVVCSPRAKGVMPEEHPLFLGVSGFGGHARVASYMRWSCPERTLVIGSRLGEFASFWSPDLVPTHGFIHVDVDPEVFGAAYPNASTLGVEADARTFLSALLEAWPEHRSGSISAESSADSWAGLANEQTPETDVDTDWSPLQAPRAAGPVRPSFLMSRIQREIIDKTDAIVLTEAGNSFAFGTHYLKFPTPRYRVSTGFGSMGHAAGGVLGAALGSGGKAVAILGDGALLMLNEINTAAAHKIDAVWIVLNDARYGMVAQGMQSIGWLPFETDFPETDFVAIARAMGADGVRVEREVDVEGALRIAVCARGPFVVDVYVDRDELAPAGARNKSLIRQGVNHGAA
jgi:acetolactate synthase-1/2/3 large subunit